MSFSIQEELRRINKLVDVLCENGAGMYLSDCIEAFCKKFEANANDFWKSFEDAKGQVLIPDYLSANLDPDAQQIRLRVSDDPDEPDVYDPDEHGQQFGYDSDY